MRIKVGDKVTTKRTVPAYYSEYGGRPKIEFRPGDIGIVSAIKVPCTYKRGYEFFNCIDFKYDFKKERVALHDDDIIKL